MKRIALYVSAADAEGFQRRLLHGAAHVRNCGDRVVTILGKVGSDGLMDASGSVPAALMDRLRAGEFDGVVADFGGTGLVLVDPDNKRAALASRRAATRAGSALGESRQEDSVRRSRESAVKRMLAAVSAGKAEVVLVTAADRMSRNIGDSIGGALFPGGRQ